MYRHLLWVGALLALFSGCDSGSDESCPRDPTQCESDAGTTPDAGGPQAPFFAKGLEQLHSATSPGVQQTFLVAAQDPQLSPLSFSWSATYGTVSVRETTIITSEATWTAPSCVPFGSPLRVTATVTNALGLSASTHYTVRGFPDCSVWSPAAAPLHSRARHTATLLPSGQVLVVGGTNGPAELYDAQSGTWSVVGSLATDRSALTATLLPSGKVLVTGGTNSSLGSVATSEVYDPETREWSATGSMAAARTEHTATRLPSGKVLVTGGRNSAEALSTAEVYDPATGAWTSTGSLALARFGHTATLLPSGKVLVAGGLSDTAELYDPATGTWASAGSFDTARQYHTATLLDSGKVLLLGGNTVNDFIYPLAALYDPETGAWSKPGGTQLRYFHTTTRLSTGVLLVTGGVHTNARIGPLRTAELYNPETGAVSSTGSLPFDFYYPTADVYHHTATLLPTGEVLALNGRNAQLLKPRAP